MSGPFACNMCNYRAPSRGILEGHRRTHTGEKPFKCDQCNYRARMNGDLIKHMRIHQDEKPYQCEFCEFSSQAQGELCGSTAGSIRRRSLTHAISAPFAAPVWQP
ncbi:hypothetical protein LAZ67_6000016 [Cordylochernes scorpioides]|uniref:C2H2-type domain-containing protein n=1 Tax=Cordylochernes scorpioides TaxID=51811 RepID=A0ABY6KI55_9ARAC|nr:hypothetical protein LAZ67_6000016 [Cordylochernes scorpioides]